MEETWIKAIQAGNYNTWPSLTVTNAHKHHPESKEIHEGHMKCQCQGIQSTKTLADINKNKGDEAKSENKPNINPQTEPKARKMKDIHIKIHNASNTMHTDQMGCFPAKSSAGNQYIMTLVEVDVNYIDAEPMKNKSAGSMIKAYLALWN
jgi:hypothetical protein